MKPSVTLERLETRRLLSAATSEQTGPPLATAAAAPRVMENLDRGVVAVRTGANSVFVSWRLLGLDPWRDTPNPIGFNLYRSTNGGGATKVNGPVLTAGTNHTDTAANVNSSHTYHVRPVLNNVEQAPSGSYTLVAGSNNDPVVRVPLQAPAPGYRTKFIWVGDLDGDGEYDFIVDRLAPFNPADNNLGMGNQYLQAYKRDGTRLWSIDLGPNSRNTYNIEPGSSTISMGMYDGVTVQDLDGDGRAEVALKIANGVVFGDGTVFTTTNNTRQFIAVINGMTGQRTSHLEMPTDYAGDGSLGTQLGVGYLDGVKPSIVGWMRNRRSDNNFNDIIAAWDFNGTAVTQKWKLLMGHGTANASGASGFHQMRVVDVDGDGIDEICPGNYLINGNGTIRYKLAGIGHGDRFHIGKFDPNRAGLQGYGIQQNPPAIMEYYYDAATGEMLWTHNGTADVGRGSAGDIDPTFPGYEVWSFHGVYNGPTNTRLTRDPATTNPDDRTPWPNLRIWWDADLTSEELDGTVINKFFPRNQADPNSYSGIGRVLTAYQMGAHTDENVPMFYGDIMGDWREEMVYTNGSYSELRIFTTNIPTATRLYTLPHNPAYRNGMTVKGYNQSHHVDYYLGAGMATPPVPNITPAPRSPTSLPPAPANLAAAVISRTQVNLTWAAAAGATSYKVKRTSNNGGPHTVIATVSGATSFADTTLSGAGADYYYVVTQVNGGGIEGIPSNQAFAIIGEPPHAGRHQAEVQTFGGGAFGNIDDGDPATYMNSNWTGTGYADFPAAAGAWVEFPNISGGGGGAATLTFRYSQGTNTTRVASLIVNGVTQSISFAYTNSPNAWSFVNANVTLKPGATNTIRIQSISAADIGNIDQMEVNVASPPAIYTGSAAADRYYLRRSGAFVDVWINGAGGGGTGAPHYSLVLAQAIALAFNGNGGDDTLTIDLAGGNPLPSSGISFDGGAGALDMLAVLGSSGADAVTFNAAALTIGGLSASHPAAERRTFDGRGGDDALTVAAGAVELAATQRLASLNVATGATLDVRDFDVVVNYASVSPVGIWTGSAYDGLTGMVRDGRVMSALATPNRFHTLGVAEARDALGIAATQTAAFAGQTVDSTSVLLKFTYGGDANLDGKINIDDYGRIDSNASKSGLVFGWFNGDFNLDGKIDIDDYGIIDANSASQTVTL